MDYLGRCRHALIACLATVSAIPLVHAQSYGRVEIIEYHDDLATYVLGQIGKTTCAASSPANSACDGQADSVISQVDYGWKALPWKTYSFGKLTETFSYETSLAGQLGTLKTIADGNNNATTLSSWKRGIPQLIRYPATPEATGGATQTAVVDNNGWIKSINDELNSRTCYDHDAMGRVKTITYPSESQASVCDTSKWAATTINFSGGHGAAYGVPAGHWRQTTQTGNGRKVLVLDALWRPLITQTQDQGNTTATNSEVITRYDPKGRVAFESYPMRTSGTAVYSNTSLKGVHTTYDALDRVTQVRADWEGAGQLTTTTEYLPGFQTRVTNPRNQQTLTAQYVTLDEPTFEFPRGISHPEGAFTEISRDTFGKVLSLKRRNATGSIALTRSYAYDANQRLCRSVEPETGATVLGYDGAGNLTWSASGLPAGTVCHATGNTAAINARKASRAYDARNRLTTLTFADGKGNQSWTYAPDGLPAKIITEQPQVIPVENTYSYNRRRLLVSESTKIASSVYLHQSNYNANGHLASLVYGSGHSVDYAPNALGQPSRAGTYATGVSYHPNGAIKQFTYGNGIVHTLTQNARGLPAVSKDAYSSTAFLQDEYAYDQQANVLAITDAATGRNQRGNRSMSYDALDRLKQTVSPMFGTAAYTYDVLDNLTRVQVGTTATMATRDHHYCYDANWRLTNVKTGSCGGATVIGLGYDVQGNLLNKSGQGYEFDLGNRLRRSVGKEWHAYDGHGRRVLSCTSTACDYQQYGSDGKLYYHRDNRSAKHFNNIYLGNSLVATWELPTAGGAVTVKYQHTDALGSPVAITDASRKVTERTEYEAYGRVGNRALRDGPGYTGHAEDAATGLVYMQQRYYDPQIGRFLSVDPVTAYEKPTDNFNRYVYARNNPYKFTDPDGRDVNCNGSSCNIRCRGSECVGDFAKYGMIRMMSDAIDLAQILFPIVQQSESTESGSTSEGGAPPLPGGLVGIGATPRGSGNSVTSGTLSPDFGGTGDYDADLETLAGETRPAGPDDKAPTGSQIGENGVFGRENSTGGRSIDIPSNGDKPHETLHYP